MRTVRPVTPIKGIWASAPVNHTKHVVLTSAVLRARWRRQIHGGEEGFQGPPRAADETGEDGAVGQTATSAEDCATPFVNSSARGGTQREPLRVPLDLHLVGSTVQTEEDARRILEEINPIFAPVGISFEAGQTWRWQDDLWLQRMDGGQWLCPFMDTEDHFAPHLQLGFVHDLGSYNALPFSCGRCALVRDEPTTSPARAAANALAQLLGLRLAPRDEYDRLMAPLGDGTRITLNEGHILRTYVRQVLGLGGPPHREPIVIPTWVWQVHDPVQYATRRSLDDTVALLDAASAIWLEAGLALELQGTCEMDTSLVSADDWATLVGEPTGLPRLGPLTHDPHAIHAFFLAADGDLHSSTHPPLLLVPDASSGDGLSGGRRLAHRLGHVLGLVNVPFAMQLMAPDQEGHLLTPHEIEKARAHAHALVGW